VPEYRSFRDRVVASDSSRKSDLLHQREAPNNQAKSDNNDEESRCEGSNVSPSAKECSSATVTIPLVIAITQPYQQHAGQGQRGSHADAIRQHQHDPERRASERDCRQQHDERGRTRYEPSGYAHSEQAAPRHGLRRVMGVHRWRVYHHGRGVGPLRRRCDKHTAMVMVMRFDVIPVRMVIGVIVVIVIVAVVRMRMIVAVIVVRIRMRMRMIVVGMAVRLDRTVGVAAGTVGVAVPPLAAASGVHNQAEPEPGDQQSTGDAQPAEHHFARQRRRNREGQP
jgi:hypothetical protein